MNESDFLKLPAQTRLFVQRLIDLGFDRTRIFGLFVMLGLYVGAPNTQEDIELLFSNLLIHLPIDRSKNIDEEIGYLYDGYEREINEFCFRSGVEFDFRKINIPKVEKDFYIVYLQDEGLLSKKINSVEKLADSTRLFDSFIYSLGKSSIRQEASLLEAFSCGIFQIALHSKADVKGSMQIAAVIKQLMPIFLSNCFNSLLSGSLEFFLGLEPDQIALLSLMQEMDQEYAEQMWGFQSYLFYKNGELIKGIEKLDCEHWFQWVLIKAKEFDKTYKTQLIPFSSSNVKLFEVPCWSKDITSFEICNRYIDKIWGYAAESLNSPIEHFEYRTLVVHLIYSSLTSSREKLH